MIEAAAPTATTDWVRALQRTGKITAASTRTLAVVIDEIAARAPDHQALDAETAMLSYAALSARAHCVARWAQRRGLRRGDTVALMADNSPDYAAVWIGLSHIGIVSALINTQLVGPGLAHCLALAAPRAIIVDDAHRSAMTDALGASEISIWALGDVDDDDADAPSMLATAPTTLADPALLIFTSGTTGLPKAAKVSHYRIMMWSEWFAGIMDARTDDRLYNCLPMYHSIGGVVAIGAMLVAGGSVVVRKGFSARGFWPDVAASGATIFQYIGELCRYLVNAPGDGAGHRLRLACGNGLRADVWSAFETRFAIPRIIEFYAATEGSFSLFNLEGRRGAIGRVPRFMAHRSPVAIIHHDVSTQQPLRNADGFCRRCAIGEAGEAIGRLASTSADLATRFEGYTSPSESERKVLRDVFAKGDAWFRTGDLMREDAQGFFYHVDRIGDTFRWKGENVATSEVADVLGSCPGVHEASVYGIEVPHADGRAGMAALVVSPDFSMDDLSRCVEARLPRYARPIAIRLRNELETTGTFKTRKADLVREGFDPNAVVDPLFVMRDGSFVPLDRAGYAAIMSGDIKF